MEPINRDKSGDSGFLLAYAPGKREKLMDEVFRLSRMCGYHPPAGRST